MKPIKFSEQNIVLLKPEGMTYEECSSLPAHKHSNGIVSCWGLTFQERIKVLLKGVVWIDVMGMNQPPVWLGVDSPFEKTKETNK